MSDGYGLLVETTRSPKNRNENMWLPKETFVNLMTVQEDELFDFSHIWNNAKMDTKGPLGNLPLFLVSSLSLNHFSKWQMFLVNIISFVIIQVFLFKISFLITNKKIVSFLVVAFYGFSQAGINTVVFLRMYALETAVTLVYIYFALVMYKKICKDNICSIRYLWKEMIAIFVTILCGTLIDYLFAIIAFFCTALMCFMILIKKQYMILIEYMLVSLLGIVAFFLIFPGGFYHFTDFDTADNMWGNSLSISMSLKIFRKIIFKDFLGINISIYNTMVPVYLFWAVVFFACIYGIIRFLFRKEIDGKDLRDKVKKFIRLTFDAFREKIFVYILFLVVIFADMILLSANINLFSMGWFSNRYLMPVYPLMAFLAIDIAHSFLSVVFTCVRINNRYKKYSVNAILLTLVVFFSILSWDGGNITFLMKNNQKTQINLSNMLNNNDAIFLCDNIGDPVLLTEKCLNVNSAYFTSITKYQLFDMGDKIKPNNKLYLVVNHNGLKEYVYENRMKDGFVDRSEPIYFASEQEILEHFKNVYNDYNIEYIGNTALWSGDASVYEISAV